MKELYLITTENELNEVLDLTDNNEELDKLYEDYLYNNKANWKQWKLICIKYDWRKYNYFWDWFYPSITKDSKKFCMARKRSWLVAGACGSQFPKTYYWLREPNHFTFRPTNKKYTFTNSWIYDF